MKLNFIGGTQYSCLFCYNRNTRYVMEEEKLNLGSVVNPST